MSAVLRAAIAQDLEDLRTHGRMRAADELSLRTGQHFNATTLPLYFTGDLNAQLVLVHLNPKQGNDHAARCTGHVPALDEYMAQHASFGRRMYGQASGRTHQSPFDHKQIRFLRPFGLIDLLAEDAPDARFTNLERVVDHKLQMEVIPYGSDTFSTAGMTPEVLAPHLNRLWTPSRPQIVASPCSAESSSARSCSRMSPRSTAFDCGRWTAGRP
jgi:hypothetical protein